MKKGSNNQSVDDEPICVLRLELNEREGAKYLEIYENDNPEDIVENFAIENSVSEYSKNDLLKNVYKQLKD